MIKMNEEKIKQFELSLKCANEMLEIQGQDGNYNYDSYMLGMYNGMEYIISLFEHREPNYRNGKEIEFLSDKQLQNNWNELKGLIDERIEDCRYFLANADVNYEKENMKKFMWLKEELQVLKSKAQELEQGKDENN